MGGADFIQVLYSEFLRFDPDNGEWPFRDRFYLDPGHMSAMLYAQLTLCGFMNVDDLKSFRQWQSPTPGHPELDKKRGIENTSGPLGLGHAFGAGSAIAERFLAQRFGEWMSHYTYIYISDGGVQEEISQGVGRIAGYLGLGKIIMFYDANEIQLSTKTNEVTSEDTARKYESWHWHVIEIDGNDEEQIRAAIHSCQKVTDKPSLIIGRTRMGKGAITADGQSYEGQVETHGKPLGKTKASFPETIKNLGGNPEDPFAIFDEVSDYYKKVLDAKRKDVADFNRKYQDWQKSFPALSSSLSDFLTGDIPALNWNSVALGQNDATRNASGKILGFLAENVPNMIVMSADLSNSDMTDGFLKKSKPFARGDFSGGFLHAGVSELTMAALCTGMALHGGVIPVCATFFAFSDYMKPVLRIAALMEQPAKFIWTHDAFRVGEDGPTHQPVEQEAQLRLLEKLHNHSGKPSFLALRPADSAETLHAWKLIFSTSDRPAGLILSRQNVKDLLPLGENRLSEASHLVKGAYIAYAKSEDADILFLGNGSEVSTLVDAAISLEEQSHYRIRVVSVPSEGLFRQQSQQYQRSVIPDGVPVLALTAGLPVTLEGFVRDNGRVFGLSHFGYSAPYTVLDEKFGFTSQNVVKLALELIEENT